MTSLTAASADVVVVGGGIIGAATAYDLSRRGLAVLLVERDRLAAQQSGRNWGFARQQGRSTAELPLMRAANARWQQLEDELGEPVGWTRGGNLALADTEAMAEQYRQWVPVGLRHGVDTRYVDADEVQRIVPGLRLPFTAAIFAASDGHADPASATYAFAQAAQRHGARIDCGVTVRALTCANGRVNGILTDTGTTHANVVVCSAGASSRALLRPLGLRLPQSTVRGTVALTTPVRPFTRATVWASGLSFRQRDDGRLIVASGGGGEVDLTLDAISQLPWFLPAFWRNRRRLRLRLGRPFLRDLARYAGRRLQVGEVEPSPNLIRVRRSIERLRQALPGLGAVAVDHAWAGLIDSTPDGLPVIDNAAGLPGLVITTGFSGHGFGLAPAIGQVAAALALGEHVSFDLRPFRLARFAQRDFLPPDAIL